MSCSTCSNNKKQTPKGCKSNGNCSTNGCNQRSTYNWLSNIDQITSHYSKVVELSFKNGRKSFINNNDKTPAQTGDVVVIEGRSGKDIGIVSLTGELVHYQMIRKKKQKSREGFPVIIRKANDEDLDIWQNAKEREDEIMIRSRKIALSKGLKMKISDVEMQADGKKATFYYTADDRVDFRDLIRGLSVEFNLKVEMKQIGSRQESSRLGGIGSCGRELCCSTWMADFRSVTTKSARYQQLSLNPQKLAGQCGKLKCCLNYELDQYVEQVSNFPSTKKKLFSKKEKATHFKTDVFRELMWYNVYNEKKTSTILCLTIDDVRSIQEMNTNNSNLNTLLDYSAIMEDNPTDDYTNVVGQDDLKRFDNQFKSRKKKRKKKSKKR